MRKHVPNIITLCNLAIGVLAVLMALENQIGFASWLILVAALLDFLDGFLARILNAASPLGRQLDSFADLISFGMAPSAIAYKLMGYAIRGDIFQWGIQDTLLPERLLLFSPILLVLFATIRLAEFNLREDSGGFSGLPTPAAAIYFAGISLFLVRHIESPAAGFMLQPLVLLANVIVISLLMISGIPMFSLKFRKYAWRDNQVRYIFLAIAGVMLIAFHETALPAIILVYLAISVFTSIIRKEKK